MRITVKRFDKSQTKNNVQVQQLTWTHVAPQCQVIPKTSQSGGVV